MYKCRVCTLYKRVLVLLWAAFIETPAKEIPGFTRHHTILLYKTIINFKVKR